MLSARARPEARCEYTLPDGWAIVAAGNRDSDRAVTTRMLTPLRNRFVHLDFEVDMQEWCEWAVRSDILFEVIAFLRFRPELLSAFDRDANAFRSSRVPYPSHKCSTA